MRDGFRVLDSDIHVIEPPEVWTEYLDPAFADRAPERVMDGAGWLRVDDRVVPAGADSPERRRALELRYTNQRQLARFAERGDDAIQELLNGTTPSGMLRAMDVEGIDVAVVFRTMAAHVIARDGMDPAFAAALCRAFNRWGADFCSAAPGRLLLGAQIPLHDGHVAAAEARIAVEELGAVTLVLPSHQVEGRPIYDPEYEPLWDVAAELDVAVSFHGIQASETAGMLANRYPDNVPLGHAAGQPVELMLTLGAVLTGGVAARRPGLRFAFLEGACGWLPWWLHALDERFDAWGDRQRLGQDELPSELFARQCWVAADVDEADVVHVVDAVGDDNLVLSTDWPHDDSAFPHAIDEFLAHDLGESAKRKILGDNCARLYGLGQR